MRLIINNKQARILGTCTGRRLLPGENVLENVSDKEIRQITENDQFRGWQNLGWVSIVQSAPVKVAAPVVEEIEEIEEIEEVGIPEDAIVVDVGVKECCKMRVSDALPLIARLEDVDLLLEWCDKDKRSTVKEELMQRIEALLPDALEEE